MTTAIRVRRSGSAACTSGRQQRGAILFVALIVMVLMSIELILNAVNINLLAFSLFNGNVDGNVFALFIIAVAAAEVGVGLALVLLVYRNRKSIALDELSEMKG